MDSGIVVLAHLGSLRRGIRRIWLLTAATTLSSAALYLLLVWRLPEPSSHRLPVVALVTMFCLAEIFVVHIEFRGDAQTFSLVEIPLVLGLYFVAPQAFVPAHILGAGLALTLYRRQPPRKLAFNLSAFALEDCVALIWFHAIAPDLDPLSRLSWIAASSSTVLACCIGIVMVFIAIAMSGGSQTRRDRREAFALGVAATVATTGISLAVAVLSRVDDAAVWLLAVPIVGLYLAHRAHVQARSEQRSLRFLRQSTGLLHRSEDVAASLRALLQRTREAFGADIAAAAYLVTAESDSLARVVIGPGDHASDLHVTTAGAWPHWEAAATASGATLLTPNRHVSSPLLDDIEIVDGMLVALEIEARRVGFLLVANRLGDVGRFTPADLGVFSTLAAHVAIGLEDGQLEQPLHQLRVLQRQLEYRASHDRVTGLANDRLFTTRLQNYLDRVPDSSSVAVLVVKVAPVPVTDAVALIVAERLKRSIRDTDLVARLDATRFAVLAESASPAVALRIERRIQANLTLPVVIDGQTVPLLADVGVEVNAADDDASVLLNRAAGEALHA